MSKKNLAYYPFKNIGQLITDEEAKEKTITTFRKYGIDIPETEASNLPIIDDSEVDLAYLDKSADTIYKINLTSPLSEIKNKLSSASILTIHENQYEQKYYDINVKDPKQAMLTLIKNHYIKKDLLLTKYSRDIDTPYGKFCLEIKESLHYKYNPFMEVSLISASYEDFNGLNKIVNQMISKSHEVISYKICKNKLLEDKYFKITNKSKAINYPATNASLLKQDVFLGLIDNKNLDEIKKIIYQMGDLNFIEQLIISGSKEFKISPNELLEIKDNIKKERLI